MTTQPNCSLTTNHDNPSMSTAKYQRLATSPASSVSDIRLKSRRSSSQETPTSPASSVTLFDAEDSSERGTYRHLPAYDLDPRFNQPKPSPYARAALIIFLVVVFIFAIYMRSEIFWSMVDQEEARIQEESEKWAERVAAQVRGLLYVRWGEIN